MILADLEPDTEPMPADGKVGICDPMPPETDANLTIGIRSQPSHRAGIVIGFHRSPNIPGLVETNRS